MTLQELEKLYDRGCAWYDYNINEIYDCAICGDKFWTTGVNYHNKEDARNIVNICRECDHKTRGY